MIGGKGHKPGDIVDAPEAAAFQVISVGRGVAFEEKAAAAPKVESADPEPENADPTPRRRRNQA